MFLEERQELIVRMVERDGKVKVKELSAASARISGHWSGKDASSAPTVAP